MKQIKVTLIAGLLAVAVGDTAFAQTTNISDTYSGTTSGTGFALGSGVNTGINPPTTRLIGSTVANLRYHPTATAKLASQYDINGSRLRVTADPTGNTAIGRFTLSANGSTAFDFGPALGTPYASATNKATYDVTISMRNNASGNPRFSFAIATVEGDTSVWDFGVQLYRNSTSDDFYTIQKRIDSNSSGTGNDSNVVMTTTVPGTWVSGSQATINFLLRITDAGAESGANYNSRIQVSTNAGASWIYDTATDSTSLPNGFRFDAGSRIIVFDQAGNASGSVFYSNFSIVSTYAPPPPPGRVWNGGGTDNNWSNADNWSGVAIASGSPLIFNGTTRQTNVNDVADLTVPSMTFSNGGFSLSGNAVTNTIAVSNLAGVNVMGNELAWNTTGAKTWHMASGSELVLNNLNTIEVNGDHNVYGGGSLRLKNAMNIGVATSANPPINLNEGQFIIDGGTLTTRGGYRIGSLASGAMAQTIVTNGGSLSITATSGNLRVGDSANPQGARLDINNGTVSLVGSAIFAVGYATGATGTVSQTGGLVSVPIVSFSHSGVGSGTYTIKNGTVSTRVIRENNASGLSAIYFDNAILNTAAGASNAFFSGLDVAEIQSGGLALDALSDVAIDQALTGVGSLSISAVDSGHVYLNGVNTYSGNTTVTNGTLGGTGSVAGNLVMLGGTNAPGLSVGTFTVNGNATLGGTTLMELDRGLSPNSDRLVVGGTLTYGGILEVVLAEGAAEPQEGDTFQLFNKGSGSSFSAISLPPLSGGLTWNTSNLAANGSISVNGSSTQPIINSVYSSGGNLILSGTGGVEGNPYAVLSSTNITLPKTNWTPLVTNTFGPGGSFSVTNAIDPAKPVNFFQLRAP